MSSDDRMPDSLGPYRLLDRIGEGGMGVVYLARDPEQRTVAVKVLRPAVAGDPNARRRLAREVETMRLVRSPFVAEVIDTDVTGERPYIVTRYVPGRTLDEVVGDQGPLRGPALARLACGLADALAAIHVAGVVHRDLKPGNVMLVNGDPVVIDFGIAQALDSTRLTMTGMFMGTPGYLSPEVIEGQQSSSASDVHAWGATVAFAATGRAPFGSGSYETIFYRIVNGNPDLAGVAGPMLRLLAAALGRDPARRPSAAQLSAEAAALDGAALVPSTAAGPAPWTAGAMASPGTRPDGTPRRGPVPGPVAGADGLAGAGGFAGADGLAGAGGFAGAGGLAGASGTALTGAPADAGVAHSAGLGNAPPGTQPIPVGQVRPGDFADMLPPVAYAPARPGGRAGGRAGGPAGDVLGAGGQPAGGPDPSAAGSGRMARDRHPLLVLATMLMAVGISVILPVAGTLVALAAIVTLRAGDLAQRGVAARRTARGARPSDPLITAAAFPWFLFRSLLGTLVLAPLALVAAALVAGVTIVAVPAHPLSRALAYAAGALVAFYGLGPGSRRARKQLNRVFSVVVGTRTAEAVALLGLGVLAFAALVAAASWPSAFWPAATPTGFVLHAPAWHGLSHIFRLRLRHLRL